MAAGLPRLRLRPAGSEERAMGTETGTGTAGGGTGVRPATAVPGGEE